MSVNIKVTGGLNIESDQIDPKAAGGLNIESGQNDPKATGGLNEQNNKFDNLTICMTDNYCGFRVR